MLAQGLAKFQFQSGAVKRIAKSLTRYRLHLFQFQSGAVKSIAPLNIVVSFV